VSWSDALRFTVIEGKTSMINSSNGMISTSSTSANTQSPGLKTYFKTPEGRYKLHYEKTHPSGLLHYAHGKTVTQVFSFLSTPFHFWVLISIPILLIRFLRLFFGVNFCLKAFWDLPISLKAEWFKNICFLVFGSLI